MLLPCGIAVSIITFGVHNALGKRLLSIMQKNPDLFYPAVDIRKVLTRDPNKQARRHKPLHTDNGDANRTQLAMMNDPRFHAKSKVKRGRAKL